MISHLGIYIHQSQSKINNYQLNLLAFSIWRCILISIQFKSIGKLVLIPNSKYEITKMTELASTKQQNPTVMWSQLVNSNDIVESQMTNFTFS